ncbi:MAG: hypothetical protein IIX48_02700 [Lachnospiraceae bacterium]|nr:hypothetical protein [Lachnospiraceae bacterium]
MSALNISDRSIDVICQNCRDGSIIPLKLRITDEDGEIQQYQIKGYRDITGRHSYQLPNGTTVTTTQEIKVFECRIECFHRQRVISIFYNPKTLIWSLCPMQDARGRETTQ